MDICMNSRPACWALSYLICIRALVMLIIHSVVTLLDRPVQQFIIANISHPIMWQPNGMSA